MGMRWPKGLRFSFKPKQIIPSCRTIFCIIINIGILINPAPNGIHNITCWNKLIELIPWKIFTQTDLGIFCQPFFLYLPRGQLYPQQQPRDFPPKVLHGYRLYNIP